MGDAALFPDDDEVSHDDKRRVRAVGVEVLREAANDGDTLLTLSDFLSRVLRRFPENRACQPDREVMLAEANFYEHSLWTAFDSDPQLVALQHLRSLEQASASMIRRRARKRNPAADPSIDWLGALKGEFGVPDTDRKRVALHDQAVALDRLFSRRLSVLTGGAGTGKTSVLKVFLQELVRAEGHHPTLLLAPTGKARVRLAGKKPDSDLVNRPNRGGFQRGPAPSRSRIEFRQRHPHRELGPPFHHEPPRAVIHA